MKRLLVCLLCICVTNVVSASAASGLLWDKLQGIQSMKASFHQTIYGKSRILSQSQGKMAFERPGHFYWQTNTPTAQLLVADGKRFWLYDIDLEQVTVRSQENAMGASAGLFLGDNKARFERDFTVSFEHQNASEIFELEAKAKEANIQRMTLIFRNDMLQGMSLYDQLGQKTQIKFDSIETNSTLPAKLFQFSPPNGVDVVEQ